MIIAVFGQINPRLFDHESFDVAEEVS